MRCFLLGIAVLTLSVAASSCQKSPDAPKPDQGLSGVWIGPDKTLEPPASMTSTGQALFEATRPLYGPRSVPVGESNDPVNTCDPQGFPRILFLRSPLSAMEFIQTPD